MTYSDQIYILFFGSFLLAKNNKPDRKLITSGTNLFDRHTYCKKTCK